MTKPYIKGVAAFAVICLFSFACTKDVQKIMVDRNKGKVAVNINVTGFTQSTGPIANSTKTINNLKVNGFADPGTIFAYNKLIYVVYDSKGVEVSRLQEQTTDPNKLYRIVNHKKILMTSTNNFGFITDTLSPGTYTLAIFHGGSDASMNRLYDNQVTSDFPLAYPADPLSTAAFYPMGQFTLEDAFAYKGQLTVTSNNVPQTITLNRIVGSLAVNIEDPIPANVSAIYMSVAHENLYYKINTSAPGGSAGYDDQVEFGVYMNPNDIGKANYKLQQYILNTTTPLTIKITAYDIYRKVIATRTISNVKISANQQTTLTGKLFNTSPNSSFSINIDKTWSPNTATISFNSGPATGVVTINDAEYPTVKINNQTWTTVNYNGAGGINYANGANDPVYGKLYTIAEVRALSLPSGWRVPTETDYENLLKSAGITSLDGEGNVLVGLSGAIKLKSTSGWTVNNGDNSSGFDALAGGYSSLGTCKEKGTTIAFWSSTPLAFEGQTNAAQFGIGIDQTSAYGLVSAISEDLRYYIRLVRDN